MSAKVLASLQAEVRARLDPRQLYLKLEIKRLRTVDWAARCAEVAK